MNWRLIEEVGEKDARHRRDVEETAEAAEVSSKWSQAQGPQSAWAGLRIVVLSPRPRLCLPKA